MGWPRLGSCPWLCHHGQVQQVFRPPGTKEGDLAGVPRDATASLKQSDVLGTLRVNPQAYILTLEQQEAYKFLKAFVDEFGKLAVKHKIVSRQAWEAHPDYWFRRVLSVQTH